VEKGVITNEFKKKHRGKIVTSFLLGSRDLYDFVDDNPAVAVLAIDYVNDTAVIRTNPTFRCPLSRRSRLGSRS
jgi:acyl-CoA hydrolase